MIKKVSLVLVMATLALTTACKKGISGTTQVTFETENHDFGTITQGDKVVYDFKFKNTGAADLIIKDAKGSCGCTVPDYPKDPIGPGEEGKITVSFNSAGKIGETSKTVTLFCNIKEGNKILHIKSNILPKGTK